MDWKREAIDMLKNYPAQRMSLATLPGELERLELERSALRSSLGEGEHVTGGGGEVGDKLLSNIVKRDEIKKNLIHSNELHFIDKKRIHRNFPPK